MKPNCLRWRILNKSLIFFIVTLTIYRLWLSYLWELWLFLLLNEFGFWWFNAQPMRERLSLIVRDVRFSNNMLILNKLFRLNIPWIQTQRWYLLTISSIKIAKAQSYGCKLKLDHAYSYESPSKSSKIIRKV